MKALMPSVLLGMAGLDHLDSDSQPEPPDCQSTESKQSVGRCKRDSVVRADRCRQTQLLKGSLEYGESTPFLNTVESLSPRPTLFRFAEQR